MKSDPNLKAVLPDDLDDIGPLLDPQACRDWLLSKLHPKGFACPRCGVPILGEQKMANLRILRSVNCESCKRSFTAFSGTIFSSSHLTPAKIVSMLYLFRQGETDGVIASRLGVDRSAVNRWRRSLIECGASMARQGHSRSRPKSSRLSLLGPGSERSEG